MKLTIGYTERAKSDLHFIAAYLRARSKGGERNVLYAIRSAVRQLAEFPESGIATDMNDVRVAVVQNYPYRVFYRPADSRLDILHIRHTRRSPLGTLF